MNNHEVSNVDFELIGDAIMKWFTKALPLQ